jgi:hypothetical protein
MTSLNNLLQHYPRICVTDSELVTLLNKSPNARYSKVKRLLAEGKLLHIRRGLYCLTEKVGYIAKPHPFELAQFIYGPSYISLESALSYHQLIPEIVYTTTSVAGKRSKDFKTPLGMFSYLHLPMDNLYLEVERVKEKEYTFFIAKPWKAICDYVFCYKKEWRNINPLIESLRINREFLPILSYEEYQVLMEYYHHNRLNRFLKGVFKELKGNV